MHLIADFYGVENVDALREVDPLRSIIFATAEECGLTVVQSLGHQFVPHGATFILLLSESHFSAHTYVETKQIHCDIYCCSHLNCSKAIDILKSRFVASSVRWTVVPRPYSPISIYEKIISLFS